jgi:hypothetical protein
MTGGDFIMTGGKSFITTTGAAQEADPLEVRMN